MLKKKLFLRQTIVLKLRELKKENGSLNIKNKNLFQKTRNVLSIEEVNLRNSQEKMLRLKKKKFLFISSSFANAQTNVFFYNLFS